MKLSRKFKSVAAIALAMALAVPAIAVPTESGAAKKIAFSKKSVTIQAGKSTTVSVKNCKKKAKTTFASSNNKVATVAKKSGNSVKITGKKKGKATVTCKKGKQTASMKVTVKKAAKSKSTGKGSSATGTGGNSNANGSGKTGSSSNDKKEEKNTVPTYPPGYVYKQRSKMVTRWYDEGTENGHHHNGYKNNNFAIWMIGFFDNNYDSTDDEKLNEGIYGPALDDYKGKELTVKGEFMYDGHDQPTVLLQLNYTKPVDYPIVWKWEKNASKQANEFAAGLKMKGVNGSENVNHGEWAKVDATFTIPADAVNGDKDEDTGEAFGIYLYFPNRPGGALLYRSDNTFHFRNFEIR